MVISYLNVTDMYDVDNGFQNFQDPRDKLLRTLVFEHEKKLRTPALQETLQSPLSPSYLSPDS